MVCDTSSGGGLPTCQIWKAYLERQKSYSSDTICYGCREQFDLEVKGHQQWYATHRLEVVYLHAKYAKPVLNDKKVTDARTDAQTDHYRASATLLRGPNQVQMREILVNLTCINRAPVYSEHKIWFQGDSVQTGFTVYTTGDHELIPK